MIANGLRYAPLGYAQATDLDPAIGLPGVGDPAAIPAGADAALIVAEAQAVRWRDDGTAPTATVGVPLAVGVELFYAGNLSAIRFFEQAGGAKLNVTYYRCAG